MKRTYLLLLFISLLMQACGTVIDLDLPGHKPRLVLNAFFTSDSTWTVHLSSSQHIMDPDTFKSINNAQVVLLSSNREIEKLRYIGNGYYRSQTNKPLLNTLYTIKVNAPGYDGIEAQDQVPVKPLIDTMTLDTTRYNFYEGEYKINFSFQDEAGTENYYNLTLLAYNTRLPGTAPEVLDIFTDEPYIGTLTPRRGKRGITFADKHFADQVVNFGVYIPRRVIESQSRVVAVLRNISADYYHYEVTLQNQLDVQSNPFKEPASIFSNVSNGFGIFAGYQVDADTLRY